MSILLLEHDQRLAGKLIEHFTRESYRVDWIRGVGTARGYLDKDDYALMVLDASPPNGPVLASLRGWRAAGIACPAIVVMAEADAGDRIHALDAGGDDCLAKPFDLLELSARARALLRRCEHPRASQVRHGDVCLDPRAHQVTKSGQPVPLSRRLFAVLSLLMEHRGRALPRQVIEEELYSWDQDVESNTVQVYIHHLRQAFGKDFIRTVRGVGYIIEHE